MNILRKAGLILASTTVVVSAVAVSAPAQARDTGWDIPTVVAHR